MTENTPTREANDAAPTAAASVVPRRAYDDLAAALANLLAARPLPQDLRRVPDAVIAASDAAEAALSHAKALAPATPETAIHLLYEHEEDGPDKTMGTTRATDVPAMLEAWLTEHGTPDNGWDDAMREAARAELADRLRLGRPGRLIKSWGGLTYDVVAVFQPPADAGGAGS